MIENIKWYINLSGQLIGPYETAELQRLIRVGDLKDDDSIFKTGEDKWGKLGDFPELQFAGASSPPVKFPYSADKITPQKIAEEITSSGVVFAKEDSTQKEPSEVVAQVQVELKIEGRAALPEAAEKTEFNLTQELAPPVRPARVVDPATKWDDIIPDDPFDFETTKTGSAPKEEPLVMKPRGPMVVEQPKVPPPQPKVPPPQPQPPAPPPLKVAPPKVVPPKVAPPEVESLVRSDLTGSVARPTPTRSYATLKSGLSLAVILAGIYIAYQTYQGRVFNFKNEGLAEDSFAIEVKARPASTALPVEGEPQSKELQRFVTTPEVTAPEAKGVKTESKELKAIREIAARTKEKQAPLEGKARNELASSTKAPASLKARSFQVQMERKKLYRLVSQMQKQTETLRQKNQWQVAELKKWKKKFNDLKVPEFSTSGKNLVFSKEWRDLKKLHDQWLKSAENFQGGRKVASTAPSVNDLKKKTIEMKKKVQALSLE